MVRGFIRHGIRSLWKRLIYLCLITTFFLITISLIKGSQLDARMIPAEEHEESRRFDSIAQVATNDDGYPMLTKNGIFVPSKRIIHLDLKGAPFLPSFYPQLFEFFAKINATGLLIEWEDMFPYSGELGTIVNRNAYNMSTVEFILKEAQRYNLQVIPLVQTMGHLEWILKTARFSHLREDPRLPQVICFSNHEAWNLLTDMIQQVADVHAKYGMTHFHIGADEAFRVGICDDGLKKLESERTVERLMLWHIGRVAKFVKQKYPKTTVMAWHDMMVNALKTDIIEYGINELIQPVMWNYAEDLDMYLPVSTWQMLKEFGSIWVSSAWKGADGPARYATHAQHYIKNHKSWSNKLTEYYREYNRVEGLILSGWSRYDHLAVLAELLPVALPTLSMCMELMMSGKSEQFPITSELMRCSPPVELSFIDSNCKFPGHRIYEEVNKLHQKRRQLRDYRENDYELNGWLSRIADEYEVSSQWYIDKIMMVFESHALDLEELENEMRTALSEIYFEDTINEFILTYLGEDLDWIRRKRKTMKKISKKSEFAVRPFVRNFSIVEECK